MNSWWPPKLEILLLMIELTSKAILGSYTWPYIALDAYRRGRDLGACTSTVSCKMGRLRSSSSTVTRNSPPDLRMKLRGYPLSVTSEEHVKSSASCPVMV